MKRLLLIIAAVVLLGAYIGIEKGYHVGKVSTVRPSAPRP